MTEVLTPKNEMGRDLSPIEARTGVVLPIWATGDGAWNHHHVAFYKRHWMNGPRKLETRAVRISRLQLVPASAHNGSAKAFHSFFEGTAFPESAGQSFGIAVLNYASYIPPFVIDMTKDSPQVAETTPEMRAELLKPGILTIERGRRTPRRIGEFLMRYAVSQNFSHVKQSEIEQFIELGKSKYLLSEDAQETRMALGLRLANIGLGVAVDGIRNTYLQARDEQALHSSQPDSAWKVAKNIVRGHEPDYFEDLEHNLAQQFGIAA